MNWLCFCILQIPTTIMAMNGQAFSTFGLWIISAFLLFVLPNHIPVKAAPGATHD